MKDKSDQYELNTNEELEKVKVSIENEFKE